MGLSKLSCIPKIAFIIYKREFFFFFVIKEKHEGEYSQKIIKSTHNNIYITSKIF